MKITATWTKWLCNPYVTLGVLIAVALLYGILCSINHNNNYLIFKYTWIHLIHHQNLYALYPEYFDHNHYGPSFAILFSFFASLPNYLGTCLWVLLNVILYYLAIYKLPLSHLQKGFIIWFTLQELITSIANVQANPAIAFMMVMAWWCMEKGLVFWAGFFVCVGMFKLYTLSCGIFFFIYPNKLKFTVYTLFWFVVFAFLPVVSISLQETIWQYHNWYERLTIKVAEESPNIAIGGFFRSVFKYNVSNNLFLLIGLGLLALTLIRVHFFSNPLFRILTLCNLLIWVVVFGLSSESPTYIIAVLGCAIWISMLTKIKWYDGVLLFLLIVLTLFSASDIFPRTLRENVIQPYALKSLPCLLIWCRIMYQQLFFARCNHQFKPLISLK